MWKPDESLDDYSVAPPEETLSKPPRAVSLRSTGAVEVLRPLGPDDVLKVRRSYRLTRLPRPQPIWFRRVLIAGCTGIVMIALVLVSAIFVGLNDSAVGPDLATIGDTTDNTGSTQGLYDVDLSYPVTLLPANRRSYVRSKAKWRSARPVVVVSKPKIERPSLQVIEPKFIPTTLVIFPKDGVITSRIEPWLEASYKKPLGIIYY